MKQVIIYPGRFQPMLSHHAEVYKQLQAQFPDADVYIGTSDKVEGDKSPFNFKEKQQIAAAHGIDPSKVILAKRPYHKDEYPFDENNTVIIFAVGEKDLDRFPMNNVDPETGLDMTVKGEPRPKYYQKINTYRTDPKPMAERGYITLAPTVKTGDEIASASAFRSALKDAPDEESAQQLYTKQFGKFDPKVFNLIYNKVKGTEMSEQLNILRKLAGLEPLAEAPVQMPDFDKGERPRNAKEREAYRAWKKSQSAAAKGDDESPLPISPKDAKAAAERPAKAAAADPTSVGFTKIKPEDMVDKRSGKPIPSKQRQKSVANQFPADADLNDPAIKKEVFLKFTAKRPDLMFGEINARLANDDEGLAASDRLSNIVRELEDTRNIMELDPEDKKFALKMLQNAIDNMELVRATDIDKQIDVEPMQLDVDDDEPELGDDEMAPVLDVDDEPVRDSVNFDDIRAEYGIEEQDVEEGNFPEGTHPCKECDGSGCDHCDDKGFHYDESIEEAEMSAKSKEWYNKGYAMGKGDVPYKNPPYGIGGAAMEAFRKGRKAGEAEKGNKTDEAVEESATEINDELWAKISARKAELMGPEDDEMEPEEAQDIAAEEFGVDPGDLNDWLDSKYDMDESIEETATNAMSAAMAELRKLAGI